MSEREISQALHSLLHDYSTSQYQSSVAGPLTSMNVVVHHLQSKLGVDLSPKLDFIRSQLQQFFFQQPHPPLLHQQQQQPFPPSLPSYKDSYAPHQPSPNFLLSCRYPPTHQIPNFLLSSGYPPSPQQQQHKPFPPPSYNDRFAPDQTPNFFLSSGFPPSHSPDSVHLESLAPAGAPLKSPKENNKGKRKDEAGGLNNLSLLSALLFV
ncbi:unnamed protein product [Linum trigynum]|uniref:Uncharacterized protein n=1 Tax=Linum trigynum TaxID=586398 RepID=A0AAV2EUN4_9ROSI